MNPTFTACRRLLEMVQVLHKKGYELLRIDPGMSPSGCHWRCEVLPSLMTVSGTSREAETFRVEPARYSSADETNYFAWTDTVSDSPEDLAAKFVERFADLARLSQGTDPAYVRWYSSMLDETAPDGIIYSYADYPLPKDHLPVHNKPGLKIPHPPSASLRHLAITKNAVTGEVVCSKRSGYYRALPHLSRTTIEKLLSILQRQRLRIEPVPSEFLKSSSRGPKIAAELARLPIYLARGVRSWGGLVVCFPGNKEALTTGFVGTPYLRRILHPMLELFRRVRSSGATDLQCLYILGERFPDVFLRKFRLLDQVIPHVVVLTADVLRSSEATAIPPMPTSKNEAWAQTVLCREMDKLSGLAAPYRGNKTHLGFISTELPTGEGTRNPERLDILAYDKIDHSLVAVEIKGPGASRIEIENLFLQGLEHRNWLEYNKMSVKLLFDGVHGRRISTRKRARLLLAFFEEQVPSLFHELRTEAMRKDRHLTIDFGRLVEIETGDLEIVPFSDYSSIR